jgi:predicted secreted acid phosphatase
MRPFSRLVPALLTGCLLLTGSPAFADCTDWEALRPQCEQDELRYGICFNRDMNRAIKQEGSEAFRQAYARKIQQAQAYLDTLTPSPDKVIITDLDETLVNNLNYYAVHKTYEPTSWQRWLKSQAHRGPYFSETLTLLKNAKAKGYSIMFVTGRQANTASETLSQVSAIPWDGVYFKPRGVTMSSAQFKMAVRRMLTGLGYTVVMSLGDQASDLDSPPDPEKGNFLLPNLMYFIP